MSAIKWEDPPTYGNVSWEAIAADLQARPGEWAIVATCRNSALAATTAGHIRVSRYVPLYGLRFEAVARTVDGEHRVYARYVGGPS